MRYTIARAAFPRRASILAAVLVALASHAFADSPGPSPERSRSALHVDAGYDVQLVATEPVVVDPITLVFDADERPWVVEMGDYPVGPPKGSPPLGRIRVLGDPDANGHYRSATTFADGLSFAKGIAFWKKGVIVTVAPDVLYLEDTDGDGRADLRRVLFTGFTVENPQLRVNHPTLGPDNRFWLANGLRGGDIRAVTTLDGSPAPITDGKPVSIRGRDFRFDPLSGEFDAVNGQSQYGLAFDDAGNRFLVTNRNPLQHVVLPTDALSGPSRSLHVPSAVLTDAGAVAAKVWPLTRNWTTSNLHQGTFTAACGIAVDVDQGDGQRIAYTCEPTGNLVRKWRLDPTGVTFTARPEREGREFLASESEWFRPVDVTIGPRGGLWVVDMCREMIEHPQWMPPEQLRLPNLRIGDHRGRLWRIVPRGAKPLSTSRQKRPAAAADAELVHDLDAPHAWRRATAQRLLTERGKTSSTAMRLESAIRDPSVTGRWSPRGRGRALWTLEGLGGVSVDGLRAALVDAAPALREQALRLMLRRDHIDPQLRDALFAAVRDGDNVAEARVRYAALLVLTRHPDLGGDHADDHLRLLRTVARLGADDRWRRDAVLLAARARAAEVAADLVAEAPTLGRVELIRELVRQALARARQSQDDRAHVATLLRRLGESTGDSTVRWRLAVLDALAADARRARKPLAAHAQAVAPDVEWPRTFIARDAAAIASGEVEGNRVDASTRLASIRLLAHVHGERTRSALATLIADDPDPTVRAAAVEALGAHGGRDAARLLLDAWPRLTPRLREAALRALTSNDERIALLYDAIDADEIRASEIPALSRRQLVGRKNAALRQRGQRLLGTAADRHEVIERYRATLGLAGNRARGRELFGEHCSNCHRVGGVGTDVAPDISDTRTRSRESLLIDILDPNRAIAGAYTSYTAVAVTGEVFTGVVAAETASGVTLRIAGGKTVTLARDELAELRSDGVSLMPEGLERELSPQSVADVIEHLKEWRY